MNSNHKPFSHRIIYKCFKQLRQLSIFSSILSNTHSKVQPFLMPCAVPVPSSLRYIEPTAIPLLILPQPIFHLTHRLALRAKPLHRALLSPRHAPFLAFRVSASCFTTSTTHLTRGWHPSPYIRVIIGSSPSQHNAYNRVRPSGGYTHTHRHAHTATLTLTRTHRDAQTHLRTHTHTDRHPSSSRHVTYHRSIPFARIAIHNKRP